MSGRAPATARLECALGSWPTPNTYLHASCDAATHAAALLLGSGAHLLLELVERAVREELVGVLGGE